MQTGFDERFLTGSPDNNPHIGSLMPLSLGAGHAKLQCLRDGQFSGAVRAFVNGILVGETELQHSLGYGDTIECPIFYFPYVDLPAQIRFYSSAGFIDPQARINVSSADDVALLVGIGDLHIETCALEHGFVRGLIINKINGVYRPIIYSRINKTVLRPAILDPPSLRQEGGCSFTFAVPVQISDLKDGGLEIDIYSADGAAPLYTFAFSRSALDGSELRMGRLESIVQELRGTSAGRAASLERQVERRLRIIQQRIDSFIEYSASLMFDRIAVERGMSDEIRGHVSAEVKTALKDIFESPGSVDQVIEIDTPSTISFMPSDAEYFGEGWHGVEGAANVQFRWMSERALIFLPTKFGVPKEIIIAIGTTYGREKPNVLARMDGEELPVDLETLGSDKYELRILPDLSSAVSTELCLILESLAYGSPALDGTGGDKRMLSIQVRDIKLKYNITAA